MSAALAAAPPPLGAAPQAAAEQVLGGLGRAWAAAPHAFALCDADGTVLAAAGGMAVAAGQPWPAGAATAAAALPTAAAAAAGRPLWAQVCLPDETAAGRGAWARHAAALLGGALQPPPPGRPQLYALIGAVARFTAHALGNPLAGLSLTLDLMAAGGPAQPKYVARCQRLGERLAAFKDGLAALGGAIRDEVQVVDVAELLARVARERGPAAPYRISAEAAAAGALRCYPALLSQALGHLVRNATDASPDGCHIRLTARREAAHLHLTVADDGPGWPPHLAGRLLEDVVSSKAHGGGLGLLLAGMIAEQLHHGAMRLDSVAPHGASVTLLLPLSASP